MFDIVKSVHQLCRGIANARAEINHQREELARQERNCEELEKLLLPLNTLVASAPKRPVSEVVKEKMRIAQRARWERRKHEEATSQAA